ncbi:hypothetical protein A9P82_03950 [Arachidicoccus ginsenosidimutans]|nr:hypothetical protein A9P82_03950 [Arachidicoccus sp. BS20]
MISFVASILFVHKTYAQNKVIELYGIVRGSDSSGVLPGASIFIKNTHRGTIANDVGIFSIAASPGDKVEISFVGYKSVTVDIPKNMKDDRLMLAPVLQEDTSYLPTAVVTPLPLPAIFRIIFLKTRVPDDHYAVALENLNIKHLMQQIKYYRPSGPGSINLLHQQQNIQSGSQKGLLPSTGILNPLSWYDFVKSLKEGGD